MLIAWGFFKSQRPTNLVATFLLSGLRRCPFDSTPREREIALYPLMTDLAWRQKPWRWARSFP